MMKKLALLLMCLAFLGCAQDMRFQIPPGKTHEDYYNAVESCGGNPRTGGACFGPAIIVAPIVAGAALYHHSKEQKFKKCMESLGFECISDRETAQPGPDEQDAQGKEAW